MQLHALSLMDQLAGAIQGGSWDRNGKNEEGKESLGLRPI